MYKIEKSSYGYHLMFGGVIETSEMSRWVEESRKVLAEAPKSFGVFVDMRTLRPLEDDAKAKMEEGQKLYKAKGMARSVVILTGALTKMQFKKIAQETGIYQWERYIDAMAHPDWEKIGIDWLTKGIDPDYSPGN